MFRLLYVLLHAIEPFLVPICFVCAWMLVLAIAWSLLGAVRDSVARAKRMHSIPCTHCEFFTNDYRLKCTVRPDIANTEKAISCADYCGKRNPLHVS